MSNCVHALREGGGWGEGVGGRGLGGRWKEGGRGERGLVLQGVGIR